MVLSQDGEFSAMRCAEVIWKTGSQGCADAMGIALALMICLARQALTIISVDMCSAPQVHPYRVNARKNMFSAAFILP